MASTYPTALDNFASNKSDDIDSKSGLDLGTSTTTGDHAQHHNDLADAINKIEIELGTIPSGSFATVAARLASRQDVRKTADQASTSTTLANTTELVFPVIENTRYAFAFNLAYRTAATTTGIRIGLTVPSGFTLLAAGVSIYGVSADSTTGALHGAISSSGDSVVSAGVAAATTDYTAVVFGTLITGATAGNLQLQHATEVSGSAATIRNGSYANLYVE